MNTFFVSDTHLGHKNIIKYCNRPFYSVEQMDEMLICNWNSVVRPNDIVYHLGDFSFGDPAKYLYRLNGKIHLVKGNHDHRYKDNVFLENGVVWVKDMYELKTFDVPIVLCHYAMRVWARSHYGAWMLYGHSHGKLPDDKTKLSIDVGVDCFDFYPVEYKKVKEIMSKKEWISPIK